MYAIRSYYELPSPVPVTVEVDPGALFSFGTIRVEGMPTDRMTKEDRVALGTIPPFGVVDPGLQPGHQFFHFAPTVSYNFV